MALFRVRAIIDPSPKDVLQSVAHSLGLRQPITVATQEATENGCFHEVPLTHCCQVALTTSTGSTTHDREISQSFKPNGSISLGFHQQKTQGTNHDLCLSQPVSVELSKPIGEQQLHSFLPINHEVSNLLTPTATNEEFIQAVESDLRLSGSTNRQKFFLTVLSEGDFELIVDEIWANMKKDNQGWKNKNQLRAGLLAFMQSLPGN